MTGACWSTTICTESERLALGLAADGEWLLTCRLSDGHHGDHATDASVQPRYDRRTWLTWNERANHRLIDSEPCVLRSHAGTPCLLFAGHGGMHYYGAPIPSGNVAMPVRPNESVDVRMPPGPAQDRHADVSVATLTSASVRPTGVAAHEAPLDVETASGPTFVEKPAAAPQSAPAAQPQSAPQHEPEEDPIAVALVQVAAALEKLSDAFRRLQ